MPEEFLFRRGDSGLIPSTEESMEWFTDKKIGSSFLVVPKEVRNPGFFKKYFALMQLAYDEWSNNIDSMEYKGERVLPNFKNFRHDTTILAGFYKSYVNLKGEVRLEAESIAWARMTEERFEKLYSKTIDVLLRMVYNGKIAPRRTEEELRDLVDQIAGF